MARQRVLIETKWSTPAATARAFGLKSKERRAISEAVKEFLKSYKGGRLFKRGRRASGKPSTMLGHRARVR